MKIFVTGGAGFIGSNLAIELERKNHQVVVLDNFFTGAEDNLKEFQGEVIKGDVTSWQNQRRRFEAIFHCGGITDARYENEEETFKKNIEGFKNIIKLAQGSKAKLIYASSASLYGNGAIPMNEEQQKDAFSAYARSKLAMDQIAESLMEEMPIVGLRYFNVFGQKESRKGRAASMIYHLRKQILEGKRPRLFNFGEQKRDHIYIKDVVNASIMALKAPSGIYNVGTGKTTDFNEIVKTLDEVLGTNSDIEYFSNPYQDKYQVNTQADTVKAEKFLGFKAQYDFNEGVRDYDNYLKQHER